MSMKITIRGGAELQAKLAKLSAELRGDAAKRAALAGAQVLEGGMKRRAQGISDTGALIGSIEARSVSSTEAQVGPSVEYAIYHEYGTGIYSTKGGGRSTPWTYFNEAAGHFVTTRGMHARPFVRPTFDADKGDAVNAATDVLRRAVDSV